VWRLSGAGCGSAPPRRSSGLATQAAAGGQRGAGRVVAPPGGRSIRSITCSARLDERPRSRGRPGRALQAARVHESLLREEVGVASMRPVRTDLNRAPAGRSGTLSRSHAVSRPPSGQTRGGAPGGAPRPSLARWPEACRRRARRGRAGCSPGGWFLFRAPFGAHTAETTRASKRIVVLPVYESGRPPGRSIFADGGDGRDHRPSGCGRWLGCHREHERTAYKGTKKTIPRHR